MVSPAWSMNDLAAPPVTWFSAAMGRSMMYPGAEAPTEMAFAMLSESMRNRPNVPPPCSCWGAL